MNFEKIIAVRNSKTVYRDAGKAIKVFDEHYSKANVLNEALNQARVEETGLKIPKLVEVSKTDGRWSIVSEYITGKTLEVLMAENPDREDEYLKKFVETQIEIQSKSAPLLTKLKDKMHRKIGETGLDATIRYELNTRLDAMPKHKKLCHGDYNPSNIIVTDDGDFYVLDWSHATIGNAAADAARTYLLFSLDGKKELAEKYMMLFCRMSDTAKQYVQKWIPIVAASQLSKGNEHEREFLMHWIDVVEYE